MNQHYSVVATTMCFVELCFEVTLSRLQPVTK